MFLSNKKKELEKLKQVEATLDGLIRSCAQQLFDLTDDDKHSAYPCLPLLPPLEGRESKAESFSLTFPHLGLRDPPGPGASPDLPGTDADGGQSSRRNQDGDPGSIRGKLSRAGRKSPAHAPPLPVPPPPLSRFRRAFVMAEEVMS